jgi:hypothetical protein
MATILAAPSGDGKSSFLPPVWGVNLGVPQRPACSCVTVVARRSVVAYGSLAKGPTWIDDLMLRAAGDQSSPGEIIVTSARSTIEQEIDHESSLLGLMVECRIGPSNGTGYRGALMVTVKRLGPGRVMACSGWDPALIRQQQKLGSLDPPPHGSSPVTLVLSSRTVSILRFAATADRISSSARWVRLSGVGEGLAHQSNHDFEARTTSSTPRHLK